MSVTFNKTPHGHRIGDVELIWARNSKDFFFANTFVVHDKVPIIIDPSANFTYLRRIALAHETYRVINTHYHGDHCALNSRFRSGIFMCHSEDAPALRSWNVFQKSLDKDPNSVYSDWVRRMWQQMHLYETPVTVELEDGQIIETDRHQLKVVHIPGHTPGMIGIHFVDIGLLFTSDIDLTPFGPWYANEVSDIDQFKQSVKKIHAIEVPYYVTSHGQRVYTRHKFVDKIEKFYRHFRRRDEAILEALKGGPKTPSELTAAGIIYRSTLLKDPLKVYFSDKLIVKHLVQLESQGKVIQEGDKYFLK
jgi:glyoxylase-like metal-dependent hydrolase (beta-lactamase superfamily II)